MSARPHFTPGKLIKPFVARRRTYEAGTPVVVMWYDDCKWFWIRMYGQHWQEYQVSAEKIAEYVISDRKAATVNN